MITPPWSRHSSGPPARSRWQPRRLLHVSAPDANLGRSDVPLSLRMIDSVRADVVFGCQLGKERE